MIGHIYCIKSKQTTDIYIGSTKITLEERLQYHKNDYNSWLNGKKQFMSSFKILEYDDYYIELIETIEYNKDDELFAREGYYQQIMKCVNKNIAGRTHKQWRIDNQEQDKQYNKQYRLKNLEQYECICGSICSKCNILRHNKTQKHITFLEQNKI